MLLMEMQGGVTFVFSEGERRIAEITSLRQSPCVLDGVDYQVVHEDAARFWLVGPTGTVGVAHRVSATDVLVSCAPHELLLRRRKRFGGSWEAYEGDRVVGSFHVKMLSAQADLPPHLPLPVRVFTFYVAIMSRSGSGMSNFAIWS